MSYVRLPHISRVLQVIDPQVEQVVHIEGTGKGNSDDLADDY